MKTFFSLGLSFGMLWLFPLSVAIADGAASDQHGALANFDKRDVPAASMVAAASVNANQAQGEEHLRTLVPGVRIGYDAVTGAPRSIAARSGILTGAKGEGRAVSAATAAAVPADDPHRAVKAFLNEHSALFGHGAEALTGAQVVREDVTARNGMRTVIWEQMLDGVPVFMGKLKANLTRKGELVTLGSGFVAGAEQAADRGIRHRRAVRSEPVIKVEEAIAQAAQNIGVSAAAGEVKERKVAAGHWRMVALVDQAL